MAALAMASSVAVVVAAAPVASMSGVSSSSVRTVRMAPVRVNRRLSVVAMATPPSGTKKDDLKDKIAQGIADAQSACAEDPTSQPCAVAWDEVEELTAEQAHQRDRAKISSDPLETYCADNPETDECRVYED